MSRVYVARVKESKWSKPKLLKHTKKTTLTTAVAETLALPRREKKAMRLYVTDTGAELALGDATTLTSLRGQTERVVHLSAVVDGSGFSANLAVVEQLQQAVAEADENAAVAVSEAAAQVQSLDGAPAETDNVSSAPVLFWRNGDAHSYLSNWHKSPFTIDGQSYNCVEQWYMWRKAQLFNDHNIAAAILVTSNPSKMKKLGRDVRRFKPALWKKYRPIVLLEGNRAKFLACPELAERLLRTGNRPIAEASPSDCICGIGLGPLDPRAQNQSYWKGLNLLGSALERVRDELRATVDGGQSSVRQLESESESESEPESESELESELELELEPELALTP